MLHLSPEYDKRYIIVLPIKKKYIIVLIYEESEESCYIQKLIPRDSLD